MKKLVALFLMMVMLGAAVPTKAMTPEEEKKARYEEVKKIKEKQRTERQAEKTNPQAAASKGRSFWQKEGERSGVGQTGAGAANALSRLNPLPFLRDQKDKYNARKAPAAGR